MARFLFIALGMLFFMQCSPKAVDKETVYAQVGSETLSLQEAKAQIPATIFQRDSIAAYETFKEDWIQNQLILREIERLDIENLTEVQQKLKRVKTEMLLASFQDAIMSSLSNESEVTTEEARNYYQKNKEKFLLDERFIRFRHLVATTRQNAELAKRDLMRGLSWENVANKYSLNPELRIRDASRFWPASIALSDYGVLNRYLQVIGVSEISIIENINGQFHFVQLLEEKTEGEHPELEWLIEQVRQWLILEKKRIAYNTYVKNLYLAAQANNEIQIYNVLPEQSNQINIPDSSNSNK